jgi:hypothetical protein
MLTTFVLAVNPDIEASNAASAVTHTNLSIIHMLVGSGSDGGTSGRVETKGCPPFPVELLVCTVHFGSMVRAAFEIQNYRRVIINPFS